MLLSSTCGICTAQVYIMTDMCELYIRRICVNFHLQGGGGGGP